MNWQNDIIFSVQLLEFMMVLNLSAWVSPTVTQNSFMEKKKSPFTLKPHTVVGRMSNLFGDSNKKHHRTL